MTNPTSNQIVDWRALCLKVRDAVAAEGEAMRFSSGVGAARRKLAAVWEEVAQAERLSDETESPTSDKPFPYEDILHPLRPPNETPTEGYEAEVVCQPEKASAPFPTIPQD